MGGLIVSGGNVSGRRRHPGVHGSDFEKIDFMIVGDDQPHYDYFFDKDGKLIGWRLSPHSPHLKRIRREVKAEHKREARRRRLAGLD